MQQIDWKQSQKTAENRRLCVRFANRPKIICSRKCERRIRIGQSKVRLMSATVRWEKGILVDTAKQTHKKNFGFLSPKMTEKWFEIYCHNLFGKRVVSRPYCDAQHQQKTIYTISASMLSLSDEKAVLSNQFWLRFLFSQSPSHNTCFGSCTLGCLIERICPHSNFFVFRKRFLARLQRVDTEWSTLAGGAGVDLILSQQFDCLMKSVLLDLRRS